MLFSIIFGNPQTNIKSKGLEKTDNSPQSNPSNDTTSSKTNTIFPENLPDMCPPSSSKAECAKTATHTQAANQTASTTAQPAAPFTVAAFAATKPAGFLATLPMAQYKELVAREKKEAHDFLHPPRAVGAAAKGNNNGKTDKKEKPPARNQGNSHAAAKSGEEVPKASEPRSEQPLPPCGIRGCPVKAPHARRVYRWNERARPNFIKIIQHKHQRGEATDAEYEKMDRFFDVHKKACQTTPATAAAQAPSRPAVNRTHQAVNQTHEAVNQTRPAVNQTHPAVIQTQVQPAPVESQSRPIDPEDSFFRSPDMTVKTV